VLVQHERERGHSPLVSTPPLGRDLLSIGVPTDPTGLWKQRKKVILAPHMVLDKTTRLPFSGDASLHCPLPFPLARLL